MIFHSEKCLSHIPKQEFAGNSFRLYPERADRVTNIVAKLEQNNISVHEPKIFEQKWIERIHSGDYIDFIKSIPSDLEAIAPTGFNISGTIHEKSSWYAKLGHYFFDPATPIMGGTPGAALAAVNCVLSMSDQLIQGKTVSAALSRPPGHHAMPNCGGGYCIFNNVAIAAEYLRARGKAVAILDLDYHHGNGTQTIFYNREDVQYVSIHADTLSNYPFYWGFPEQQGEGEGLGHTHNLAVPNTISESDYLETLNNAIDIVEDYNPDILLVSMGFDCHVDDPIAGLSLNEASYTRIGGRLQRFDHLGLVLEGGYAVEKIGSSFVNLFEAVQD